MDVIETLIQVVATASSMLVMAAVTLYLARKTGLHDIQVAAKDEMGKVIDAQDKRIELLESEVEELREENKLLHAQIKADRARIRALEKVIASKNIEEVE